MSRIQACFEGLRAEGRRALIPYVTAGDPQPNITVPLMHAMVEAGANIIELGVPFSDPMADGPVIQRASERALEHGTSLQDVLAMVKTFRSQDQQTPVVLMGYLNPIEVMGYETFAEAAAQAGVDGVLTVDLPPEEGHEFVTLLKARNLDPIFLVAPTSSEDRIRTICEVASGFVYYVSLKGVTGAANIDVDAVQEKIKLMRNITTLPIGVGFGIKDANSATQVAGFSDAVIVGSALVRKVEAHPEQTDEIVSQITAVLASIREAIDHISG